VETRRIGSLQVTLVGLGCNNFAWRIDEAASARVVHAALDAGINFFDSADVYGDTLSEQFLGRALGGRRREAVIATKFGTRLDDQRRGARPEYVRRAVEDSLRRLGTDRIDLYQLHRPDPQTPIADTLGALDELVRAGKVREIGCSNFSLAQLREAEAPSEASRQAGSGSASPRQAEAPTEARPLGSASPGARTSPGAARFVSLQNEYSLLQRDAEREVIPECLRAGIAFLPYYPLASGLLTGKYRRGQPAPQDSRVAAWERFSDLLTDRSLDLVEALSQFAASRGHTLLELAFSWLAARPAVASVIAGATSPAQVEANALAAGWRLTPAELAEIDTIAPGA